MWYAEQEYDYNPYNDDGDGNCDAEGHARNQVALMLAVKVLMSLMVVLVTVMVEVL